ncbi:hypothetical protein CDD83_2115 [Cordyceps sp. RAO-2017]|nr:hypothetical protein CDD83_2115 [Cordyceps sp. RAO-2017]
MSVPASKDNLARIRDNQRRSRARRREYLQELEQRLRVYELQGVEASTEVQMAARRVADENRQLRDLLNRHGVSDDHIAHYLQSGTLLPLDSAHAQPFRAGAPAAAVQSLQHLLVPRPLAGLDQTMSFPLPSPSSRETSTTSGSTTSSTVWESPQPTMPSFGHHHQHQHHHQHHHQHQQQQQHMTVAHATVMASPVHSAYPPTTFAGSATAARPDSVFVGQPSPSMLSDPCQPMATTQAAPIGGRPAMHMHYPLPTYQDPTGQPYGPAGTGC